MTAHYECPLCHKEIPRDAAVFLEHGREHIVEVIKKNHPEWVASNGTCQKCLEYYEDQLK